MQQVVVVSAMRTPVCHAVKGALAGIRPDMLLAGVIRETLARTPQADRNELDDVLIGCAGQEAEQGLNIARYGAVLAGVPPTVPAATLNRLCASGSSAFVLGVTQILSGQADMLLCGGVESLSRVPLGGFNPSIAPLLLERHTETVTTVGVAAENLARRYSLSRDAQDRWALESQRKAQAAWESGEFAPEVAPVRFQDGHGNEHHVTRDDTLRAPDGQALSGLAPAFVSGGTVTAGNSAPLADGAAALLLMSASRAEALGVEPLARVRAVATTAIQADVTGLAAARAVHKVLTRSGLTLNDFQVIELGEQHAASALATLREVSMEPDARINPKGGAISLGHPGGAAGARMLCTLVHTLSRSKGARGLMAHAAMGGQGVAVVLEAV